ncbi:MAG: DUF1501 domain-containing protein, partial [Verrucomicrobiae bacterium]|nr:DUF1501 domain-containing protein [Verrucomicrobiae bacterium]
SLWGSGYLPSVYQGVQCRSEGEPVLYLDNPPGVSRDLRRRSLDALDKLNASIADEVGDPETVTRVSQYEMAYRMQSSATDAFDISKEPEWVHQLYGTQPGKEAFANNCLLARRLVDHGVRFVQVQLGGWDTHYDNFTGVEGRCREFDRAYAALITDLEKRGKLEETLVVVATEFGRTPEINTDHNGGRDHHPSAFSCLLAGGGVKGGYKHGLTDSSGSKVKDGMVTVQDFNATIAHALGLYTTQIVMSPSGRPFKVADKGEAVKEVFA